MKSWKKFIEEMISFWMKLEIYFFLDEIGRNLHENFVQNFRRISKNAE